MTDSESPSNRKSGVEDTIPIQKYCDLCSCVFCWKYSKMKTCDECEKLFCKNHIENHLCFKEEQAISSVSSKPYNELTEAITL